MTKKSDVFIYLACPFSHWFFLVRWWRFVKACRIAAKLMMRGYVVFSPISHSFPIAHFMPDKYMLDFNLWMTQDLPMVDWCTHMVIIPCGRAWKKSRGVQREIMHLVNLGLNNYHNTPVMRSAWLYDAKGVLGRRIA